MLTRQATQLPEAPLLSCVRGVENGRRNVCLRCVRCGWWAGALSSNWVPWRCTGVQVKRGVHQACTLRSCRFFVIMRQGRRRKRKSSFRPVSNPVSHLFPSSIFHQQHPLSNPQKTKLNQMRTQFYNSTSPLVSILNNSLGFVCAASKSFYLNLEL